MPLVGLWSGQVSCEHVYGIMFLECMDYNYYEHFETLLCTSKAVIVYFEKFDRRGIDIVVFDSTSLFKFMENRMVMSCVQKINEPLLYSFIQEVNLKLDFL